MILIEYDEAKAEYEKIGFFLIELHAYKIGNSIPAPKFEVIEMPNDFIKNSKPQQGINSSMNRSQSERLEFWIKFNEVLTERGKPFNLRKPSTDHWYSIAIGASGVEISITLVNKENLIGIEVCIKDNKELFDSLYTEKENIENEVGLSFDWQRLDAKKASRMLHKIDGLNFDDHTNYKELMNLIIDKIQMIKPVFTKHIKEYL